LKRPGLLAEIECQNRGALFFGCSTAGEISGVQVTDDSLVLTSVLFERTKIRAASVDLATAGGSAAAGEALAAALPASLPEAGKLNHVLVLADGLATNGSQLVDAMVAHLPASVIVAGGLAGDGGRFAETLVLADGAARPGTVVALGFYGEDLSVGCSAFGGWDHSARSAASRNPAATSSMSWMANPH